MSFRRNRGPGGAPAGGHHRRDLRAHLGGAQSTTVTSH